MTHGSLFSGIGGFDLAASRMGWDNVFQVEIDPFCRRVLQKNFPDAQRFDDIRQFDGGDFAGKVDIISGGFPCQPFSVAGKRRGKDDDRALWGEMLRVIRTIRPAWIVGENVAGIISMELDTVLSDMESIGYTGQAFVIPACAVNAIHRRDRVWIVAHAKSPIEEQSRLSRHRRTGYTDDGCCDGGVATNTNRARREEFDLSAQPKRQGFDSGLSSFGTVEWQPLDTSDLLRTAYGIPGRVDRRGARIKSLGNAIVPQVAFNIYHAISLCG
jgi:DNA (cytosine-5)-methyltransferase 1